MQIKKMISKCFQYFKNLQSRYKVIIVSFLVIVFLSVIIALLNIEKIDSFFDFTLLDVVNLITTLIIGFFFTYIVSVSLQKESKENEIFDECLSNINVDAKKLIDLLEANQSNEISKELRAHILVIDGILTADVCAFKKFCLENNKFQEEDFRAILTTRRDFHVIVTGDSFGLGKIISLPYLQKSLQYYYELQQNVLKFKLKLIQS